jgi:hypothetical protein
MGPELEKGSLRDKFDVLIFVDGAIAGRAANDLTPHLRKFLEGGGTILTIGNSTALGYQLGLPIASHLNSKDDSPLPRAKYYVPTSVLRVRVDTKDPLAWGMSDEVDVVFANSPTFRLSAEAKGMRRVAWFDSKTPLRSGWAWGQQYLDQAVSIIEAPVGKGHVVLFGNEVNWRAQPHGTFKLLFNGIYYGSAMAAASGARTTDGQP